ncbi:Phthalate 4,5-dioxygenase oxygenase subunit [Candidatus Entotheonellaceae bacterium PAL068K]
MLTKEENERITRVGPGTPMGALMRQYWLPVLLASELEPGGRVKRVKLLGEALVAFRSRNGKVGLLGEFCSHRRASLYFGRNEESGLRCVYHGWKYDLEGQCVDMPNVLPDSRFHDKVCHPAYPCVERGGVIWTYMGAADLPFEPPDLEWTQVPESQRLVTRFYQACNYLQALEGGIDPSHISFLHGVVDAGDDASRQDLDRAAAGFALAVQLARAPHLEVVDTDYGVLLGARRDTDEDMYYWRITQFHMPFYTMPPTDPKPDPILHSHIFVPVDDENLVNWCISWHPTRALTADELAAMHAGLSIHITTYAPATSAAYGDIRPQASQHNDYLMDWQAHQTRKFFGVPGVGAQDKAITENQQPIVDRTQECLNRADIGIIRVRKGLLAAAAALEAHGIHPPGTESASFRIRSASVILPKDTPWAEGAKAQLEAPRSSV